MELEDNDENFRGRARSRLAPASEALLRAEINFWRELLGESEGALPADSIERMRQALALAEHRFLHLCRAAGQGGGSRERPPRTRRQTGGRLH
jgi:hypothetical protein